MMISGPMRMSATTAPRNGRHHDTPAPAAGAALVPVAATSERAPVAYSMARHDAFFVTQLIAMAQHSPQTRMLRRATPQDAGAAYRSAAAQTQDVAQTHPRVVRVT